MICQFFENQLSQVIHFTAEKNKVYLVLPIAWKIIFIVLTDYVISRTFQFLGLILDQKELEELERYSRNANHHDHGHHHEHGHEASEDIFDRAARVGIRVFDGKDREGADDLGNDLELIGGM